MRKACPINEVDVFCLQPNDDRKKVAAAITQRWVIRDDNMGGLKEEIEKLVAEIENGPSPRGRRPVLLITKD
jgi:hypothetical protein